MTQTTDPMFIVSIDENAMILCERHAQVFDITAKTASVPYTIMEIVSSDTAYFCHACDLKETVDEMNRPKIILPGDLH